jgi:hypothetical protein
MSAKSNKIKLSERSHFVKSNPLKRRLHKHLNRRLMARYAQCSMLFIIMITIKTDFSFAQNLTNSFQTKQDISISPSFSSALGDFQLDIQARQQQMKRNKHILLGWGVANAASGIALYPTEYRDFGLMNASWGLINSGIALLAMRDGSTSGSSLSFAEMLRQEQQFNRIVALNAGLDVGYMIAGLWMMTEGNSSMVRQYGTSVLIQGAFLFVYDLWLMVESTRYLNRLTVVPAPGGLVLRVGL